MAPMQYSAAGLALTKSFEGLRLTAYADIGGVLTIGYGHTGADVTDGETITQDQADALLSSDVVTAVAYVNEVFANSTLEQNQFDALVDFCFNAGCHSFARSSVVAATLAGNLTAAAARFGLWVYAGGHPVAGLVRRRAAEAAMFRGVAS